MNRDVRFPTRPSVALAKASARSVETKGVLFTPQNAAWEFGLPGSRLGSIEFAKEVGNGMSSSVVTSALCWMMRTFPEAPVIVQREVEERWESVNKHDLTKLLRRPNSQYSGVTLWQATIMEFCFGEAYWLKVRSGEMGTDGKHKLVELWWVPRALITPKANENTGALSHYDYRPGKGPQLELSPDDVVHFRFGQDPHNILRGFSPLAAVMREVYTDDQAANFTAAVLKNLGIIGVIFSPKDGTIPQEQAQKLKDYVQQSFTGEKRGQAMMFTGAMTAQLLQYNLQGFDLGPIRDIAEERVTAALGIPAAVIGFGTGLQQTKVGATMREMIKLAWQGGIEPNQRAFAAEMDRSLLPEFQANDSLFRTHFDTSQVEALTETPAEKTDRVLKLVDKNVIKVAQAQRELGYPVDASQDKYARELSAPPPPIAPPAPAEAPPKTPADPPADDPTAGKSITVEGATINVAPPAVHLNLTIEAPRAGTKRSATMTSVGPNGEPREVKVEMTETMDEPHANGDGPA